MARFPEGKTQDKVIHETSFARAEYPIEQLTNLVLPHSPNPTLLEVGVGLQQRAGSILCPTVPYQLAARLLSFGADFRMDLLDIDQVVLEDVKHRSKLFVQNNSYFTNADVRIGWDVYLRDTNQTDILVESHPELMVNAARDQLRAKRERYTYPGYRMADIPAQFREMLTSGDISLLHSDISTTALETDKYDMINCMFVLYQLDQTAQESALQNMAKALRPGGKLLITDANYPYGLMKSPIFKRIGGWLESSKLSELGLAEFSADQQRSFKGVQVNMVLNRAL